MNMFISNKHDTICIFMKLPTLSTIPPSFRVRTSLIVGRFHNYISGFSSATSSLVFCLFCSTLLRFLSLVLSSVFCFCFLYRLQPANISGTCSWNHSSFITLFRCYNFPKTIFPFLPFWADIIIDRRNYHWFQWRSLQNKAEAFWDWCVSPGAKWFSEPKSLGTHEHSQTCMRPWHMLAITLFYAGHWWWWWWWWTFLGFFHSSAYLHICNSY